MIQDPYKSPLNKGGLYRSYIGIIGGLYGAYTLRVLEYQCVTSTTKTDEK